MSIRLSKALLPIMLFSQTLLLSSACSQTGGSEAGATAVESTPPPADIPGIVLCTEPRPEICTQQYMPVCGVHSDGSRRTYPNSCSACSNTDVVGSLPGACPESAGDR